MKGFILKDLLLTKNNLKAMILMLIVFAIISITTAELSVSFYIPMIAVMLCITTFSYDEFNKWDAYALTMPITRKDIVKSKYIFAILMIVGSLLIGMALSIGVGLYKNNLDINATLSSMAGAVIGVVVFLAIMYPLMFKYGSQKGRMMLFAVVAAIVLGVMGISKLIKNINFNIPINIQRFFTDYSYIFIGLITILVIYISYRISVRIYKKKEF